MNGKRFDALDVGAQSALLFENGERGGPGERGDCRVFFFLTRLADFLGPVFARVHMHRCARFAKIRPYSKISDEAFLLLYAVFLATWPQHGPKMLSGRARAHARAHAQMRAFSRKS